MDCDFRKAAIDFLMNNRKVCESHKAVLNTAAKRQLFKSHMRCYSVNKKGELLYAGKPIPSDFDVVRVLQRAHVTEKGHVKDWKRLRIVLANEGYTMPKHMGGLEAAVKQ